MSTEPVVADMSMQVTEVSGAAVWAGAPELESLLEPIGNVALDPENARLHPLRNMEVIKASLQRFGQRKPIVVREGVVYAGNGTLTAAKELGWTHIATVTFTGSEEEARAYGLVDNKSSDLAEWDFQMVGAVLRDLPTELLDDTGFADFEREPLLKAEWKPASVKPDAPTEGPPKMVPFYATPEQATIIKGALAAVREQGGAGPEMSDGRCLELLCADYLSGAAPQPQ